MAKALHRALMARNVPLMQLRCLRTSAGSLAHQKSSAVAQEEQPLVPGSNVPIEGLSSMNIKAGTDRDVSYVEDAQDPSFADMVEYFFNRGASIVEDHLVQTLKGRMTQDEKRHRVQGILKVIKPVDTILSCERV